MMYDIGIIGGGTAGLTAAIYGQRAGKRTLVIEGGAFGGQITTSPKVENYPGIASVSGSEFSMNLLDQAMKLGTEPVRERVTGILEEDGIKIIVTTEREYPCKSIILATGVTHRHLGVPGEERLTGAGVSYCATCDGMFFRGKEVAVVGGGSTALDGKDDRDATRECDFVVHSVIGICCFVVFRFLFPEGIVLLGLRAGICRRRQMTSPGNGLWLCSFLRR